MSRLEQLINELCHNGVDYFSLSDLGSLYGGLTGKSKTDFGSGNRKFITYMNVFSNISIDPSIYEIVNIKDNEKQNSIKYGDIIFTASSESIPEVGMSSAVTTELDEEIFLNSFCFGFRLNNPQLLDANFSKYLFRSQGVRKQIINTGNGVTRFNISKGKFLDVIIPVPPLEVQCEIVRILDNFTELTAELQKRKSQYEFYKYQILNFENDSIFNPRSVKYYKIKELFHLRNGYTPSKRISEFWTNGTIPWFRMEGIRENGRILNNSLQHITPDAIKNSGLFSPNSLIISTSATIGEHALINVPFLCNQRFTSLSLKEQYAENINVKYLFYYFYIVGDWCKQNINEGNFASVDMARFEKLEVPIPERNEQDKIVSILDNFDILVNDLTSGLPAEIEARQKQYEYYRDKLLDFKDVNGNEKL